MQHSFNGLPLVILVWMTQSASAQMVLSEIMFNPAGNERHDEFIELCNLSPTDSIDLHDWILCDGDGCNRIRANGMGTRLAPRQYAILLVPGYTANSTLYEGRIPATALRLTIDATQFGLNGLHNSRSETVSLMTPDSVLAGQWAYTVPNAEGISEEKISLAAGDDPGNWTHSKEVHGTPGASNSVSPLPVDAALIPGSLRIDPPCPQENQSAQILCQIENVGLADLLDVRVTAFLDAENDSTWIAAQTIDFLASGATASVRLQWPRVPAGACTLCTGIEAAGDACTDNNRLCISLVGGYEKADVIVNEIMILPGAGDPEWAELYNRGERTIDLTAWYFCDAESSHTTALMPAGSLLPPGGYLVVCPDSAWLKAHVMATAITAQIGKWPSLSSTQDAFRLFDGSRRCVEAVTWNEKWQIERGKSLERISPRVPTQERSNWGACTEASGHTAGRKNSLFLDGLPLQAAFDAAPNPFSPDGDGREDHLAIQYHLPLKTARINLRIFDTLGRQVRFLCNHEASGSQRTLFWDGCDDTGRRCRVGPYILFLEAFDAESGRSLQLKKVCILAGKL